MCVYCLTIIILENGYLLYKERHYFISRNMLQISKQNKHFEVKYCENAKFLHNNISMMFVEHIFVIFKC